MGCHGPRQARLTDAQRDQIRAEVKQAATEHLHSKDAYTALNNYMEDTIAVTNTMMFSSKDKLSEFVNTYYDTLNEVNLAVWDEIYINVINSDTALFTATCRYSFTNISDEKIDLKGIWTALFVRHDGTWKIQVRHESFEEQDD